MINHLNIWVKLLFLKELYLFYYFKNIDQKYIKSTAKILVIF